MVRTMSRAGELARERGHDYLGTEHLILALIEDTNGIAGGVMHRLECAAAVRDEVRRIMESDGYSRRTAGPSDAALRR
jgi:ATP-dependent Clp protease ATP-binding subunit ClpA